MPSPRALALAGTLAGATGLAAAGGAALAARRWHEAHDPTDGEPLCLPDGTEETVTTPDGARLATVVAGDDGDAGGAFVLSHCWTGDRRVWGPVARRLVDRGHRVVLYDQRGHGSSTSGRDGFTLRALADDLAAVLHHTDMSDAVVAGHSMGGMAAQSLAVEHPHLVRERIRAMVLVATACGQLSRGGVFDRVAGRAVGSTRLTRALANPRLGPFLVRGSLGRSPARPHLEAVRETFGATAPETRAGFLAAMGAMDFSEALAAVDVPVVVACGTHDRLTPLAQSRRLAEVIPTAELEVLPDKGHMLPCEAPDELTEILENAASAAP
jgi:pimeloyl-ACP methyl ester carboxylesterase